MAYRRYFGKKGCKDPEANAQAFHIFDLPTNLDTDFYEYDQPLIELTAPDRKRCDNLNLYQAHIKVTILIQSKGLFYMIYSLTRGGPAVDHDHSLGLDNNTLRISLSSIGTR
jgi:hypothetical protein